MNVDDLAGAFSSLLHAAPRGLNLDRFAQNRNLTAEEAGQLFVNSSTRSVATPSGMIGFSAENWNRLKTAIVEALTSLHRRTPALIPSEERVLLEAGLRLPKEVAAALAAELAKVGTIVRGASGVRLRTHVAQLSPADAALWKKTEALLNESVLRPPSLHQIGSALSMDPKTMESFLVRVARLGFLVRVSEHRFFPPARLRSLALFTEEIAAADQGSVTGGALRDRTGIGRTLAIEVLEYFDRIKFTRRAGNEHHVLRPAREAFGDD
jgi:selenocysteine-specific elongation factor